MDDLVRDLVCKPFLERDSSDLHVEVSYKEYMLQGDCKLSATDMHDNMQNASRYMEQICYIMFQRIIYEQEENRS